MTGQNKNLDLFLHYETFFIFMHYNKAKESRKKNIFLVANFLVAGALKQYIFSSFSKTNK